MTSNRWDSIRKSYDLAAATLISLAGIAFTVLGVQSVLLRSVVAIPLVLLLPGYTLVALLFPERRRLEQIERILYAVGLSLAIAVLMGLFLNVTPWGISATSFAVMLGAITLAASAGAHVRRGQGSFSPLNRKDLQLFRFKPIQITLMAYAGLLIVCAIVLSWDSANRARPAKFTELWMLPGANQSGQTAELGIHNMENQTVTYILQLTDGETIVQEWESITLEAGQTWTDTWTPDSGDEGVITALLFREDQPDEVYRHATLDLEASQ